MGWMTTGSKFSHIILLVFALPIILFHNIKDRIQIANADRKMFRNDTRKGS